jgi:acylphosphatase
MPRGLALVVWRVAPFQRLLRFCLGASCARAVVQDRIAKRYFVSGMVQGVGFRFFATRVAQRLGLAGWVKNLADGRVEVYAIGGHRALKDLLSELQRGPNGAMVDGVLEEEAEIDPQFATHFTIEREGW